MNQLLANVLEAHGGLSRWNKYQKVEAAIVTGVIWLGHRLFVRRRNASASHTRPAVDLPAGVR